MKKVLLFGEPMALLTTSTVSSLEAADGFIKSLAGAEVNVAIGLTRLNYQVTYLSCIGSDPWGKYIRHKLFTEQIDTSQLIENSEYPTGMMMKNQVVDGDPDIYYYRKDSAFSNFDLSIIDQIDFTQYDHVHVTGIPLALTDKTRQACLELAKRAKKHGVYVSYDPNLRPQLWPNTETMIQVTNEMAKYCDLILPGINEGKILMGSTDLKEMADYFMNLGVKELVIKLGAEGAYYTDGQQHSIVEGFKVETVVDTVGAGDGFAVGIISGRLDGLSPKQMLIRGNAIGAIQVQTLGDNEGLPTMEQLNHYIQNA